MEELIKDRVYRIQLKCYLDVGDGFINVYYLKKESILIDAGFNTRRNFRILLEGLRSLGVSLSDIKGVILTHIHLDHCGLLELFPKHIPIYCHGDFKYLKDSKDFDRIKSVFLTSSQFDNEYIKSVENGIVSSTAINLVSRFNVYDANKVNIHKNIKILTLLGHTCLDICIEICELNIIFTGDLFVRGVFVDSILDYKIINLKEEYIKSMYFLLERKNKYLYFGGHGEFYTTKEINNDILKKIKKNKKYLVKACNFLKEERSIAELCQKMFPLLEKFSPFLQFSEVYMSIYLLEKAGIVEINGTMIKCIDQEYKIKIEDIFDKYKLT